MEPLLEFGLEVNRWLQETYPGLDGFFKFIRNLGEFEFYLVLIPLLYWCVHKKFGKYLAFLIAYSSLINYTLKHLTQLPRPYWLERNPTGLEAPGYSMPSGHAQHGIVLYLFLATWLRRSWVWIGCVVMIMLMGLSSLYLDLHFIHDVLVGYLTGGFIIASFLLYRRLFHDRFLNRILGQRLLFVFVLPLLLAAIYLIIRLIIGPPSPDVAWASFLEAAERASIEDLATTIGTLLGLSMGFILESGRVYFKVEGGLLKRIGRFLLGMAVTLLIWAGLDAIFPEDPLWLAVPLRIIRYFVTGFWVAYYAPWSFVRLGLAEASPEPEVQLSISNGSIMRG